MKKVVFLMFQRFLLVIKGEGEYIAIPHYHAA
jgi:hypothetical protein